MTASVDTTSGALLQMASMAQQVATDSQQMSATVQAIWQLNAQIAQARSAVERLTEQIARFRLAESGASPAQGFGQPVELSKAA